MDQYTNYLKNNKIIFLNYYIVLFYIINFIYIIYNYYLIKDSIEMFC